MAFEASVRQHLVNLEHLRSLANEAFQSKQLPELSSIPSEVLHTLLVTTCLATAILVMLVPRSRKMVLETAEAILTIFLLILLLGVVLGMPVGVMYMSYRGVSFLYTSLLANVPPQLGAWLGAVTSGSKQQ